MLPPPSLPVHQCAVYSYVCVQKRDGEGQGIPESPGCSSWRYSSLSLLPLSDNSAVIQAGVGRAVLARDEAPWPLEIHFHPAFISFSFSVGLHPTLTPIQLESIITEPWSILIHPSLSTNYKKKAPQNMKSSSKQATEHFSLTGEVQM